MAAKSLSPGERKAYTYTAGVGRQGTDLANLVDGKFRGMAEHTVLIPSADVLTLNATPFEIVPAPGAGKGIIFHGSLLFVDFNSAAYAKDAGGDTLKIAYTGSTAITVTLASPSSDAFIEATADAWKWARVGAGQSGIVAVPANLGLEISVNGGGELNTGDSPWYVRTFYSVSDLAI